MAAIGTIFVNKIKYFLVIAKTIISLEDIFYFACELSYNCSMLLALHIGYCLYLLEETP